MFLDAFANDAAWQGRYCRKKGGEGGGASSPPPWEVIEKAISDSHPYSVLALRVSLLFCFFFFFFSFEEKSGASRRTNSNKRTFFLFSLLSLPFQAMLAVPYFEKRLYEFPDDQVTAERILQLADDVERDVELGPSPRPLLSVPHPLSDESSAYYHGYVLAEMAVLQTRAALAEKLAGGSENVAALVDDPRVGEALLEYWEPGNTVPYLDLVKRVTGGPLSAAAWVSVLEEPLEAKLAREKAAFEEGVARGPKFASLGKEGGGGGPSSGDALDLGARIVIVHGDEKVADSAVDGGVAGADAAFRAWIEKNWPRKKGAAAAQA